MRRIMQIAVLAFVIQAESAELPARIMVLPRIFTANRAGVEISIKSKSPKEYIVTLLWPGSRDGIQAPLTIAYAGSSSPEAGTRPTLAAVTYPAGGGNWTGYRMSIPDPPAGTFFIQVALEQHEIRRLTARGVIHCLIIVSARHQTDDSAVRVQPVRLEEIMLPPSEKQQRKKTAEAPPPRLEFLHRES